MPRLVKKSDTGPLKIEVGGESKFICMCGLSSNQPYCDGRHKVTRDEDPAKIYRYDDKGGREAVE